MSIYTLQPWVQDQNRFGTLIITGRNPDGCREDLICIFSYPNPRNVNNAQRIISCVNACEGMDDPEFEINEMRKKIEELTNKLNKNEQK